MIQCPLPKLLPSLMAPLMVVLLTACAVPHTRTAEPVHEARSDGEAFASTYTPPPSGRVYIHNARILTGTGARIDDGAILIENGRIAAVGRALDVPAGGESPGVEIVDAAGQWVTPGLIDNHSHLGVYPAPSVWAHADGNEMSDPNTAQVWAEHSVWPQDPGFSRALAAGVTTLALLPGSANLFGGRIVTVRNVPARTVQEMKFPGAPYGLKMACGENPKRVYGQMKNRAPATRMGNVAGYRSAWIAAQEYRRKWAQYEEKRANGNNAGDPPTRSLQLETLAGVLDGEILVHNHCYRSDEMAIMIDIAREFDYKITAFHHAVESYKIVDLLKTEEICSAMWADWWGFKLEAWDGIRENVAMVQAGGACAIIHSDSPVGVQRLNQEAAKALAAGRRAGLDIAPETAIAWITLNPARSLGIDHETGSLEAGKRADLVVWNADPFSVYALPERVYMDGALMWDRADPARQSVGDFELGIGQAGGAL